VCWNRCRERIDVVDAEELQRLNAVALSTGDVLAFLRAGVETRSLRTRTRRDAGVGPAATRFLQHEAAGKAMALLCRMQALADLLHEGIPGWVSPDAGPGVSAYSSTALFAAAASHPLTLSGTTYAFDRQSFLERLLAGAESATSA
jgi:hypothetical protein